MNKPNFYARQGMLLNDKLRTAACRADEPVATTVAINALLLTYAARAKTPGDIGFVLISDICRAIDVNGYTVKNVIRGLESVGIIINGRYADWEQYDKEALRVLDAAFHGQKREAPHE